MNCSEFISKQCSITVDIFNFCPLNMQCFTATEISLSLS